MEPMEDDGGWPAPKKGDYLCTCLCTKGNGFVNYDGCQVEVKTDYENKVINVVQQE